MILAQKLEQLLQPIEGDNPAGVYLKNDRTSYRPLRNAYNVAQTSLRKLTNNPPEDELDDLQQENIRNWQELSDQLVTVVSERSKDLECMSWLSLGQLFTQQPYENLASCLQLVSGAIEGFGEQVQPCILDSKLRASDEAGKRAERATQQLKPLAQLFGESEETCLLGLPLRMLPLVGDIDFASWRNADRHGSRNELQQQVRQALAENQDEVINRVLALHSALNALDAVDEVLSAYAKEQGVTSVSSRFLRTQLTANLNAIKILTEGALVPWPLDVLAKAEPEQAAIENEVVNQASDETNESVTAVTKTAASPAIGEQIYNRDQAFQQLRLVADYFSRTEPQSPVSGLIEKAIRWGYTPLPDLINELVQGHEGLMGRIGELTGMNNDKVHIPGAPAQGLVTPPTESPLAPSQAEPVAAAVAEVQAVEPSIPEKKKVAVAPKNSVPSAVPSFLNLSAKEKKKSVARKPLGPGGIDLAQLRK